MEWDVRNWSLAGEFWLRNTKRDLSRCRVLDVGGRDGGLSLFLSLMGAEVVCSDLTGPSEKARELHVRYGLGDKVAYAAVDALDMPYPDESFDLVTFKSVLGGVRTKENQQKMMSEIFRVLRPGGELWFAENLVGSFAHRLLRRLFVSWGRTWRYVSFAEIQHYLSPYEDAVTRRYGFWAAFGRSERQRWWLGGLDRLFDRYTPMAWKYIAFVVARKPTT